jgi:hypothetical protein
MRQVGRTTEVSPLRPVIALRGVAPLPQTYCPSAGWSACGSRSAESPAASGGALHAHVVATVLPPGRIPLPQLLEDAAEQAVPAEVDS